MWNNEKLGKNQLQSAKGHNSTKKLWILSEYILRNLDIFGSKGHWSLETFSKYFSIYCERIHSFLGLLCHLADWIFFFSVFSHQFFQCTGQGSLRLTFLHYSQMLCMHIYTYIPYIPIYSYISHRRIIHTHLHACITLHIHIIHPSIHTYIHTCMHACMHAYNIHISSYTYLHTNLYLPYMHILILYASLS